MKRIWPYIYALFFVASALAGLFGSGYEHTNVDWAFVGISFLMLLIFPSMAVSYALTRTAGKLPRASFARGFSGLWWTDPMQCLQTSILSLSGWFLGSLVTLPHVSSQGIMIVWWKLAMLLGMTSGNLVARNKYRNSIT
jgi:hypothetical protein